MAAVSCGCQLGWLYVFAYVDLLTVNLCRSLCNLINEHCLHKLTLASSLLVFVFGISSTCRRMTEPRPKVPQKNW